MSKCTANELDFGRLGRRVIEANFEGGALSSDGGLVLLQQADRKNGLSAAVASALHDPRHPDLIVHELRDLVAQRLYGLCCGYEDLNDPAALRQDPLMQTAVGTGATLGSSPTLCRLERRASRTEVVALNRVLVEQFIASQATPPAELVLDVDASDIPLHGDQEQREFHAYYDHYCYLPLYVLLLQVHAGLRAAQEPHRRGETCRHRDQAHGHPIASSLARGADHRPRRFGLLSPAPDPLVRKKPDRLRHRRGEKCPAAPDRRRLGTGDGSPLLSRPCKTLRSRISRGIRLNLPHRNLAGIKITSVMVKYFQTQR